MLTPASPGSRPRPWSRGRTRALKRRGSWTPFHFVENAQGDGEDMWDQIGEEPSPPVVTLRRVQAGTVRLHRRPRAARRHRAHGRHTSRRIGGRAAGGGSESGPDPPPRLRGGLRGPAAQHSPQARRPERPSRLLADGRHEIQWATPCPRCRRDRGAA